MPRIKVIGVGPGSRDYLTPAAKEALDATKAVVGGQRHIEQLTRPDQKTFILKNNLDEALDFIRHHREIGVAVLASGDPGLYGILTYLRRCFRPEELEVIPGISSVQLAFARLAMPWQDALILSAHGRSIDEKFLSEVIRGHPKVAILTGPSCPPTRIAKLLVENGMARKKVYCCCNLSYPDEYILGTTAQELNGNQLHLTHNCVMVILDES